MIDDEFGEWYATIQVQPFQGTSAWGETFGAAVPVEAFWNIENRVVISSDGKTVTSDTHLFCGTQYRAALVEGSKVTLPDDARVYRVASIGTWPGDDSHLEVNLA